ncbi:right-handed parallel beta-helix repeat-containing protein [Microbacterium sp. H1-D42]|uniref:right-handed parallel beta-helix repeat-containing protein n=1 Tax=Microbacterium sp. H1-D42 TaxID=2925844 RepID=UPI001F530D6B|nr:right-handed parallel beta-helix repeat-containing protein [Microbacterium sp. H1-D42]UNK70531.1 right-handed parallel beta-helix repeat-containing protein [Microbacterium sp. H1-D42]
MKIPHRYPAIFAAIALTATGVIAASPALASADELTVVVAPDGKASAPSGDKVVKSIAAAKKFVKNKGAKQDVRVILAGGTYELDEPLRFDSKDGGRDGHTVTWAAAAGEKVVLSGGDEVSGWRLHDAAANIWVADVAPGTQSRQLYVDGKSAKRTQMLLAQDKKDRAHLEWTDQGINLLDDRFGDLSALQNQGSLEIVSMGSFTDRVSPVASIEGDTINMVQPAWENNNVGYDTLKSPYNRGALYLANAYEFFESAGEWFLDSDDGQVYYKTAPGQDMAELDVRLPHLETLIEVGGTYAKPVTGLRFEGLAFADTTWNRPSSKWGYADQQSGAHIVKDYDVPDDYLTECQDGCPEFEETRNEWWQIPAAVQVSAASRIGFAGNTFESLGSVGLGVGMDPNAHATGVGYGAADIDITGNTFQEIAGSGIVVGGIQPDAHHPTDARMIVSDVTIEDNLITRIGQGYRDSAGILSTYVTRAEISHNTLTDLPYDGIDIGWGWGINDPGGNQYYKDAGLYEYQPVYDTPTTFRDNHVAYNLIYDTKNEMHDGGSIYTLSASQGTVIERNYIYDSRETFGILIDQGSRYIETRENVILGSSRYIYVNADTEGPEIFNTLDLNFVSNWWDGGRERYVREPEYRTYWTDNVDLNEVEREDWPGEAKIVMAEAGARTENGERPVSVLVSPTSAGPHSGVELRVDAADRGGLDRIVANVYKGGALVKSTQAKIDGATSASHKAALDLPDGDYTVKYNSRDVAGNTSATGVYEFTIDTTAPTATVKDGAEFTEGDDSGYDVVSFKLHDQGKIDRVDINGVEKDLTDAVWSDVNAVKAGTLGAVSGENTLTVHDVAGNTAQVKFVLK